MHLYIHVTPISCRLHEISNEKLTIGVNLLDSFDYVNCDILLAIYSHKSYFLINLFNTYVQMPLYSNCFACKMVKLYIASYNT